MLLADFIKDGTGRLEALYPREEARAIILMLCGHFIGTKSHTHIVEPAFSVPPDKEEVLSEALCRVEAGEPVQYVTGETEFCGFTFRVSRDVLIPRPETELLCREAVKIAGGMLRGGIYGNGPAPARNCSSRSGGRPVPTVDCRPCYGDKNPAPVRILDLCTGSGCIAWVMALSVPGAEVIGVDNSDAALAVASSQRPLNDSLTLPAAPSTPSFPNLCPAPNSLTPPLPGHIPPSATVFTTPCPIHETPPSCTDPYSRRSPWAGACPPGHTRIDVISGGHAPIGNLPPGHTAPRFLNMDILDTGQPFTHGRFHIILSNPPYVLDSERSRMRPNVLDHEPASALFVPDDDPLLFYRAIARWSRRLLLPGGVGITEINETLGPETAAVFRSAGFSLAEILQDLNGKDRFVLYR